MQTKITQIMPKDAVLYIGLDSNWLLTCFYSTEVGCSPGHFFKIIYFYQIQKGLNNQFLMDYWAEFDYFKEARVQN